jgi:hypothetical protein
MPWAVAQAVGDHQASTLAHGGRQRVERGGGGPRAENGQVVALRWPARAVFAALELSE